MLQQWPPRLIDGEYAPVYLCTLSVPCLAAALGTFLISKSALFPYCVQWGSSAKTWSTGALPCHGGGLPNVQVYANPFLHRDKKGDAICSQAWRPRRLNLTRHQRPQTRPHDRREIGEEVVTTSASGRTVLTCYSGFPSAGGRLRRRKDSIRSAVRKAMGRLRVSR